MSSPSRCTPLPSPRYCLWRILACGLLLLSFLGCAHKPRQPPAPPRAQGNPVVRYALSLQGVPYVWGAESPEEGFDCSGFVQHVYGRFGIDLPRTAYQQAMALPAIPDYARRPGDLLFFNTTGKPYSHVGIYIGRNAFVHASSARGGVVVSALDRPYWSDRYLGLRRPQRYDR